VHNKYLPTTNIVFSGRFNKEYITGSTLFLTSKGHSPPGARAIIYNCKKKKEVNY